MPEIKGTVTEDLVKQALYSGEVNKLLKAQVRTITSIMLKVPGGSSCFLGQFHCLTPAGSGIIHDLSLATSGSPTLWCQPSFRLRCPVSK